MSSLNYYSILEIERSATLEEVSNAFRRLTIKYNPGANISNAGSNQVRFDLICEAYDVLSNHERKAIFDKYGEYGLKNGVTSNEGKQIKSYTYLGNSMEIFNHYFSTTHLNNDVYEMDGSDVFGSLNNDAMKGKNQRKPFPPKNVEVTVKCSL